MIEAAFSQQAVALCIPLCIYFFKSLAPKYRNLIGQIRFARMGFDSW